MKKLLMFVLVIVFFNAHAQQTQQREKYQCIPCGNDCDKISYDKEGMCPHCNMKLVKQSSVTFASISPAQVCDYIAKHPDIVILDVRTKEEYEGKTDTFGTLKNAVNIPVQELENRVGELKDAKDKEIIVYCSYSKRSPRASYFLSTNGFTHVINMDGGMSSMQDGRCKK